MLTILMNPGLLALSCQTNCGYRCALEIAKIWRRVVQILTIENDDLLVLWQKCVGALDEVLFWRVTPTHSLTLAH